MRTPPTGVSTAICANAGVTTAAVSRAAAEISKVFMARMASNLGGLIAIEQEVWEGDKLTFQMRALAQSAAGTIEVFEDSIRIDVMLPWLLAKLGERLIPAMKREATLLLEKK